MNSNKNISYFFSLIILIYIFSTNSYFNYEDSLIFGGADGYSYYEISKYSPNITSIEIQPIHSERFFFPYIIGAISKISNLDIYSLYRVFVIILILLINKHFIDILIKFNKNVYFILLSLLILNLNPYLTRYYIAVPLIINDLFFIYGSLIIINSLQEENKKKVFLGLIIASFARQSAAAICLSFLIVKIIQKKSFFIKNSEIIFSFLIFIFIYVLNYTYSSLVPSTVSRGEQYFVTIFGLFSENKTFKELIIFFIWPFLSFAPLLIYYFLFIKNNSIKFSVHKSLNLYVIFFTSLIILQPVMQGIDVSGKNIIRLSTLAFPAILNYFLINSRDEYYSKINIASFSFLVIFWSFHPTFSIFELFEKYRF